MVELPLNNKNFKDLNPVSFGYQHCEPGHAFGPYIRTYYLIHYIVSGKGTLQAGGKTFPVSQHQAFLIKPGEVTHYEADKKEPWYYIWIGFTGEAANRLSAIENRVLKKKTRLFEEMMEAEHFSNTREEYLAGKLWCYFSLLFETGKKNDFVEQILNYIDYNYMNPVKVEEIAKMVNLERHYLSRIFRERTGKTIKQVLTEKRLSEAERFLKNGHSVTETALLTGYGDMFCFSKAFKKASGLSPQAFQKECKESVEDRERSN